jgi:formylglycine-generating enzyme required for sulfatase activity
MQMATVPEGWFWMGSDNNYAREGPRHQVWLQAFQIAVRTVTRREYSEFVSAVNHPEPAGWRAEMFASPDQPVVGVNWFDAVCYCSWLSEQTGQVFRLPTEAEWEKACRGGLETAEYAWGDADPSVFPYFTSVWTGPRPAGQWHSNGYGLFNCGENVHEWCSDWFSETYYQQSPVRNPLGPAEGSRRVSRGGSWRHHVKASRCAHRSSLPPDYRYTDYGFRVVRSPDQDAPAT